MAKEKSNKDPPGILEWMVDFFVSPLERAITGATKPILDNIAEVTVKPKIEQIKVDYEKNTAAARALLKARSAISPDEAFKAAWSYVSGVEPWMYLTYGSMAALEAITFGGPSVFLSLPYYRQDIEKVLRIRMIEEDTGIFPAMERYWRKQYTPLIPEAYRLALAAAKDIAMPLAYNQAMAENGLDSDWAYVYREQNYNPPDFGILTELFWRGKISDATFTHFMKLNAYPDDAIEYMKELRKSIPPAGDLITMVVREAFDPKYITPAPDVFAEYMAKRGFSKDWSDRYWTSHWVPMPLSQAYANLHRGFWTKEQFLELLKIADIHPTWREGIYNVAFNPPSIREMGYGYDVGVYTIDDIKKYRRWGGLSEEDANKAGTAMVAYRTEAERNAVRMEYMYAYGREEIERPTLEDKLKEIGTAPEAIPLWVQRADLYKERIKKVPAMPEPKIPSSTEALWAFEHGIRDEAWTRSALADLLWTEERINLAVDHVKASIKEKEVPPPPLYRDLPLADLRKAFRDMLITEAEFRVQLTLRKFSDEDIGLIVLLELGKRPVPPPEKIAELTYTQLAYLFRKQIIDVEEFRIELAARKYSTADIDKLIAGERVKMEVPTPEVHYRKLSLAQVQDLYSVGKIASADLPMSLQDIGYGAENSEELAQLIRNNVAKELMPRKLTKGEVEELYDYAVYNIADVLDYYTSLNYSDEDAVNLTFGTLVSTLEPYVRAWYSKGWINADGVLNELLATGIDKDKAEELAMTIVKYEQPARTATEKDLTKAEIVKGVKLGIITADLAVGLLMDLGYDESEAWYILDINKVVSAGDPEGYWDMKRVTEEYKRARGLPFKKVPQELIDAEKAVSIKKGEIEKLKAEKAPDTVIGKGLADLANLEYRYRQLMITYEKSK